MGFGLGFQGFGFIGFGLRDFAITWRFRFFGKPDSVGLLIGLQLQDLDVALCRSRVFKRIRLRVDDVRPNI